MHHTGSSKDERHFNPMQLLLAKKSCECPVCGSLAIRRSTRKGLVERVWLRIAFVWPYRCDDCDARFWNFRRSYPSASDLQTENS
jgi:predicted RNA-binding Zn-ribbon protein involved in translation (DUF1610 family)